MAITTRYAVNMAMQYNETDISQFLINPSVGSRRFLTEAEQTRLLRATETSALYFLTDVTGAGRSARYRWYDSGGTLLNEYLLDMTSAGVHNSIPIDWTSFYVPSGATRLTVAIIDSANGFANGQFTLGSGDLFTSWTLTQPSRTNLVLRSQEFNNASWTKGSSTIVANSVTAPDGTTTADTWVEANGVGITPEIVKAISLSNTTQYTWSVYAKPSGRDWIVINANDGTASYRTWFNINTGVVGTNPGGSTARIFLDENGFYRCIVTRTTGVAAAGSLYDLQIANADGVNTYTGNGTSGVYIWGAQLEASANATPYNPSVTVPNTTSLGEFLQDATGGEDGSRCLRMWTAYAGLTVLSQAVSLVSGSNYTIRFRAKVDTIMESDVINIVAGVTDVGDTNITDEWAWYSITFTAVATASETIYFTYLNDAIYGFVSLDDISISITTPSELSEVRTYNLDDSCVAYEYELNWLNKLGGRDTWVFTGFPTTARDVQREGQLEYSRRTNLTAPSRIYGYRSVASRESITLTHQCKDRLTAEWLKSELIDTLDVLVKVGTEYYPADVVASSIVVSNTFSQDFTIRFTLRYAFDINVQTR
jgi:hypothetical protein